MLHLLMTNPAISGCGERNTPYRDEQDLVTLGIKSIIARKEKRFASYFVDQLNHTHFLPSDDLLLHPAVMPIILFREPQDAIASMVDVFNQFGDFTVDEGVEYYRERVTKLSHHAAELTANNRMMALTYDELVGDTDNVLNRLKDYVALPTPLSSEYATFPFTGRQGDPSSRIRAGKVLPGRTNHGVEIDAATLDELQVIYDECLRVCR